MNRRDRLVAAKPQSMSVNMLMTPETSNQMPNRPDQTPASSRLTPEQRTQATAPKVGILFVHDNFAWIDSTPLGTC